MATRKTAVPPRDALLKAGLKLAEHVDYGEASAEGVAEAAGLPVAVLHTHFVDFSYYLIALQQQFLDELRDNIIKATSGQPPGYQRLQTATLTYLDGCLRHHGLRSWLMEARRELAGVADGLRRQNQSYALIISTEFRAQGWPHPLAGARLFLSVIQEASRAEHWAGRPLREMRNAIWDFLRTYDKP